MRAKQLNNLNCSLSAISSINVLFSAVLFRLIRGLILGANCYRFSFESLDLLYGKIEANTYLSELVVFCISRQLVQGSRPASMTLTLTEFLCLSPLKRKSLQK